MPRPPRPRPLFVDKPLPALTKDDPAGYSLFIEGVVLLAYNIAWVCCSQGVSFGDRNSYDDVCNMGANLYKLLIGESLHRKTADPGFGTNFPSTVGTPTDPDQDIGKAKTQMGRWSHGTTHTFLGGSEGSEFVRSFKLPSPTKLGDRLKKKLTSDAPMLEWETIESDDAKGMEEHEEGVLVKGYKGLASDTASDGGSERRSSGMSGWTRLKNR
jgi:hypothetical protein